MKVSKKRLILRFGYSIGLRIMVLVRFVLKRIKEEAGIKIISLDMRVTNSIGSVQRLGQRIVDIKQNE
ncbi:hypothetical protein QFZ80_003703 [Paenibacillus sp. V4I7]|nr:hypothetical protein [Paenibacillus sp. V4I7]MDQ0914171.1 hypothetical protein [Paenibacillus sp. V4I5]